MKMNIVLAVLMCGSAASAETFSRVAADVSALPESARFIEKILNIFEYFILYDVANFELARRNIRLFFSEKKYGNRAKS